MSRVVRQAVIEFTDAGSSHRRTGLRGQTIEPAAGEVAALETSGATGLSTDTPASLETAQLARLTEYETAMHDRSKPLPAYTASAIAKALKQTQ
jgi:hypothetical protein